MAEQEIIQLIVPQCTQFKRRVGTSNIFKSNWRQKLLKR